MKEAKKKKKNSSLEDIEDEEIKKNSSNFDKKNEEEQEKNENIERKNTQKQEKINQNDEIENQTKKKESINNSRITNKIENTEKENNDTKLEKYNIIKEITNFKNYKAYEVQLKENLDIKKIAFEFEKKNEMTKDNIEKLIKDLNNNIKIKSKEYFIQINDYSINNKIYYLITEYCSEGNLRNKILEYKEKNMEFTEDQIKKLSLQLLNMIKYININNIECPNINIDNIFITDKNVNNTNSNEITYKFKIFNILPLTTSSKRKNTTENNNEMEKNNIQSFGIIINQLLLLDPEISIYNYYSISNIKEKKNLSDSLIEFLDMIFSEDELGSKLTVDKCLKHQWLTGVQKKKSGKNSFNSLNKKSKKNKNKDSTNSINNVNNNINNNYNNISNNTNSIYNINMNNINVNNASINTSNPNNIKISINEDIRDSNNNNNTSTFVLKNYNSNKITFSHNKCNDLIFVSEKINNFMCKDNKSINTNIFGNNNMLCLSKTKSSNSLNHSNKSLKLDDDSNRSNGQKIPTLVEETIKYIKYYIKIHFHKDKELLKLDKLFAKTLKAEKITNHTKSEVLPWAKIYVLFLNYIEKRRLSIECFGSQKRVFSGNENNSDKIFNREEFHKILIKSKTNYLEKTLKRSFDLLKKSTVEEIFSVFDQKQESEYDIFFDEMKAQMQKNKYKKIYLFYEYTNLIHSAVDKLYKPENYRQFFGSSKKYKQSYSMKSKKDGLKIEINVDNISKSGTNDFFSESNKFIKSVKSFNLDSRYNLNDSINKDSHKNEINENNKNPNLNIEKKESIKKIIHDVKINEEEKKNDEKIEEKNENKKEEIKIEKIEEKKEELKTEKKENKKEEIKIEKIEEKKEEIKTEKKENKKEEIKVEKKEEIKEEVKIEKKEDKKEDKKEEKKEEGKNKSTKKIVEPQKMENEILNESDDWTSSQSIDDEDKFDPEKFLQIIGKA